MQSTQNLIAGLGLSTVVAIPLALVASPLWVFAVWAVFCVLFVLVLILQAVERLSSAGPARPPEADGSPAEGRGDAGRRAAAESEWR